MEKITLSVNEWINMQDKNHGDNTTVWFSVTGNSMYPFIRAYQDKVMLMSIKKEEYKIGDIVLFDAKCKGGDYCLHRIYKMNDNEVQTFGDGRKSPDHWISKDRLLGKAIVIKRGNKTIDCESNKWIRIFKLWNSFWRIRPVLLFPFKVKNKCQIIIDKILKK